MTWLRNLKRLRTAETVDATLGTETCTSDGNYLVEVLGIGFAPAEDCIHSDDHHYVQYGKGNSSYLSCARNDLK